MTLDDVLQLFKQVNGQPVLGAHHGGKLYSNSFLNGGIQQGGSTNKYYPFSGLTYDGNSTAYNSPTAAASFSVCPVTCQLKNLFIKSSDSYSGNQESFQLFVNGVQTSLSATIGASSTTASTDSSVSVSVSRGDTLSFHYKSGSVGTADEVAWTCEIDVP